MTLGPNFYDFAQAAEVLRVSESALRKAVANREVPFHRILQKKVYFTDDDLDQIVAQGEFVPRQYRRSRR